jgi:DNA-binding NtrC family response regulator
VPVQRVAPAEQLERLERHRTFGGLRELRDRARQDDPTPASRSPVSEEELPDPTREEIIEVLRQTRGKMRTTAQLLKIDRRRLYRLCKAYDINPDDYRDRPGPEN